MVAKFNKKSIAQRGKKPRKKIKGVINADMRMILY